MRCVIDQDALLGSLRLVHGIVDPRTSLPILSQVLLATEGPALRLTATDTETTVRVTVPGEALAEGRVTLPAQKFVELVRELAPLPVTVEADTPARITISCGSARYRLAGGPAEDFPEPDLPADGAQVAPSAETLKAMLAQTSFAISADSSRYALTGLLVELAETTLTMVATDGHRLALARCPVPPASPATAGIVPRKAVQQLGRLLRSGESANLTLAERAFAFTMPGMTLSTRLIDGQFPNYRAVIPSNHPITLRVPRQALGVGLRRVAILAESATRPVRVTLEPGALILASGMTELGEAEERLSIAYDGTPLALGVNAGYLLEALAPLETDQVVLDLKDPLSPILVRPEPGADALSVIMPLRL